MALCQIGRIILNEGVRQKWIAKLLFLLWELKDLTMDGYFKISQLSKTVFITYTPVRNKIEPFL